MRWAEFDNPEQEKVKKEKTLKENPNDASAYYNLAAVHASMLDFSTAIELCEKAIDLDPKNITYRALYSFAYTNIEEHGKAIEELAAIIELGSDESDYYVDKARDAQVGMDKEYAVSKVVDLRKEGKDRIADKLEEWLI
jgi:cytochrome c-type biogenesis protein CcmH/NrfG